MSADNGLPRAGKMRSGAIVERAVWTKPAAVRGNWPTPTVNNMHDKGTSPTEYTRHTPDLSAAVFTSFEEASLHVPPKRLSPRWVEQLMGFQSGWTLIPEEKSRALQGTQRQGLCEDGA